MRWTREPHVESWFIDNVPNVFPLANDAFINFLFLFPLLNVEKNVSSYRWFSVLPDWKRWSKFKHRRELEKDSISLKKKFIIEMINARCSPNKRIYNNFIQLLSNFIIICPISNFTIPLKEQLHRTIFHLFIVNNFTNLFVPPLHGANTKLSKTLIIIIAKLFEPSAFCREGVAFRQRCSQLVA